jgi:exodeoxyribonuclease V alpha subunit
MNAHRINAGDVPIIPPIKDGEVSDFMLVEREDPASAVDAIKKLVQVQIPSKFGFDARADIQVITPMHRGLLGAQNMNRELQNLLNPRGRGIERSGIAFRPGDKVMQTSNDYDKDVFNGDIGFISSVNQDDHTLRVNFDGRLVFYESSDLDDLELAYAITVHKSQGSEYRAVVMPVHTTHFVMLQRNLLYTAVTRGRGLVVLVGQKRAMAMAVDNFTSTDRNTGLAQRLAAGDGQHGDDKAPITDHDNFSSFWHGRGLTAGIVAAQQKKYEKSSQQKREGTGVGQHGNGRANQCSCEFYKQEQPQYQNDECHASNTEGE